MNKGIPFIKIADHVEVNIHLKGKRVSGPPLDLSYETRQGVLLAKRLVGIRDAYHFFSYSSTNGVDQSCGNISYVFRELLDDFFCPWFDVRA